MTQLFLKRLKYPKRTEPRIGAGGKQYGTGFELRLPAGWTGRFLMQGGGGWDGTVASALGVINPYTPNDTALNRGFAVASTDAGHYGDSPVDPWWAADEKARHDNGYHSARIVTERSRNIMETYYGKLPDRSYFMGCSNGGRQGMIAATRYPEYFDGVVAGAPAFDLVHSIVAWNWNTRALKELADAETGGDLSATFSDADLSLVSTAAIEACDMQDGSDDNLVFATLQCRFDPAVLQCQDGQDDQCLSDAQVVALTKIQNGPRNSAGEQIYEGWNLAGIDGPTGFRLWELGAAPGPMPTSLGGMFQQNWLRHISHTPPNPDYDPNTFTPDDIAMVEANGDIWDATGTDYDGFRQKGGKLLVWHGTADGAFSAQHLASWFESLQADNGGAEETADFARLFYAPGLHHCAGGAGMTTFDALTPLVDWVENGVAPDSISASGVLPGGDVPVERPLCPYPSYARPDGNGGFACDK